MHFPQTQHKAGRVVRHKAHLFQLNYRLLSLIQSVLHLRESQRAQSSHPEVAETQEGTP